MEIDVVAGVTEGKAVHVGSILHGGDAVAKNAWKIMSGYTGRTSVSIVIVKDNAAS
jgi:hypothetical protein